MWRGHSYRIKHSPSNYLNQEFGYQISIINRDWKSLEEDFKIILTTTTRVMYGNKSVTLILYVHNLKILPPKLILKTKHLKFAIEENLISILNYDALFQLRTFQIFWGEKYS